MGDPVLLSHASSLRHDTGEGHPERPDRVRAVEVEVERRGGIGWERRPSSPATDEQLALVHPRDHVDGVRELARCGGGRIDMDTVVSPGSWEAALHGAGGACDAVRLVASGEARSAFSLHRPPGHHAEPNRAMGFCLLSSAAIAARFAVEELGVGRVLVLDWDVHHGNGTQEALIDRDDALFVSVHQSPLYPGTGAVGETGIGAGEGCTVNLPVPPGSGDETFVSLVQDVVAPLCEAYRPGLVLVSAGFDAHADDPLGSCVVSDAGFAAMARAARRMAEACGAPVCGLLEGGYDLGAGARGVCETLAAFGDPDGAGEPEDVALHPLAAEARSRLARGRFAGAFAS